MAPPPQAAPAPPQDQTYATHQCIMNFILRLDAPKPTEDPLPPAKKNANAPALVDLPAGLPEACRIAAHAAHHSLQRF